MIRVFLAALAVCALFAGLASAQEAKAKSTGPGKRTVVRKVNGKWRPFHFHDRQRMKKGHPERRFQLAPIEGIQNRRIADRLGQATPISDVRQ